MPKSVHQRRPGVEFDDVGEFHERFGLPNVTFHKVDPRLLDDETFEFRLKFMQEELDEFRDAHREGRLADSFDGLLDLAYVVFGTAHLMGLPWKEGWREVQDANMKKVRAPDAESSKRGSQLDVIKPEGWEPPNIDAIIEWYSR